MLGDEQKGVGGVGVVFWCTNVEYKVQRNEFVRAKLNSVMFALRSETQRFRGSKNQSCAGVSFDHTQRTILNR